MRYSLPLKFFFIFLLNKVTPDFLECGLHNTGKYEVMETSGVFSAVPPLVSIYLLIYFFILS